MKIRTIIIDDEPIALEKLKNYVSKVPFLELAGICQSAMEAITVLSESDIDAVFTDINMPDLNGIEFISSLSHPPIVVFITAYAQYAADSYKLDAVDYLLKPYGFADFQRSANKVLDAFTIRAQKKDAAATATVNHTSANEAIFIKVDYRYIRVSLPDIKYIKGYGEYLQIYVIGNNNPLLTLSSFAGIMERLSLNFIQVHRSYIVNMNHVHHIERARIVIEPDIYIPIGESNKAKLSEYLQLHSIGPSPRK